MVADHSSVVPLLDLLRVFQGIAHLLCAEIGVSLLHGGLGGQVGVEDAVAVAVGEAGGDAEEDEDGGAQVHSHFWRLTNTNCLVIFTVLLLPV